MTTLIEDIQARLDPVLAGGSFYAVNTLEADENTVYPYAVFLFASSNTNNTLAGPTDQQNTRVQVDVYAVDPTSLDASGKSVAAALLAGPFKSIWELNSQDGYEDATRAYRRTIDFSIWSTN